ncbi:hypothetical protein ACFE04_024585 [Oxalis oulophora]
MECNRDEAVRAKEIAEKKFLAKDYNGAKRFVLKAQALYPSLDGISHMLATVDLYIAAENKIYGECDWYGILNLSPHADHEMMKKHYRKLVLTLHPDKNKSIGADGAFNLVKEAWSLLSDKNLRAAYDQKINARVFFKAATPIAQTSKEKTASSSKPPKSAPKENHSTNFPPPSHSKPTSSHKPKKTTFWTVCLKCKLQYEYLRVYINQTLLCPNCNEPFIAEEIPPQSAKFTRPWYFDSSRETLRHQASKSAKKAASPTVDSQWIPFSGAQPSVTQASKSTKNAASPNVDSQWIPFSGAQPSVTQAATFVQQAYEKVKREREEAQAAAKRKEALLRKKQAASKRSSGMSSSSNASKKKKMNIVNDIPVASNITNQMGLGTGKAEPTDVSGSKQFNSETSEANGVTKPNTTREEYAMQQLMMIAKNKISKKLQEWPLGTSTKTVAKEEKVQVKAEKADETRDQNILGKLKSSSPSSVTNTDTLQTMTMAVTDPDFHDFDRDRIEHSFGENQVWAAYDDDDGMPRYYAMIHSVISLEPFKMRISWLNSKTNTEFGPLNWVSSGFTKTCGDFRVGKHVINTSLNSFSHKVDRWVKGTRGLIQIYPKKGDVWALYRNWSTEWNELTADEVIHKYDMVEVLEDYSEELGVRVAPLTKVAGFKTIFHRHLDSEQVKTIPREEMFRFSHQVPSYLFTGQEESNAPKGCRELDPAAIPLELLQVIAPVENDK